GVVGPVPGPWRRFGAYDAVWALNSDGWSTYRAVSVAFESPQWSGGLLFLNYTVSETRDNLFGLTRERPWASLPPIATASGVKDWAEGRSDLDVPQRATIGAVVKLP